MNFDRTTLLCVLLADLKTISEIIKEDGNMISPHEKGALETWVKVLSSIGWSNEEINNVFERAEIGVRV